MRISAVLVSVTYIFPINNLTWPVSTQRFYKSLNCTRFLGQEYAVSAIQSVEYLDEVEKNKIAPVIPFSRKEMSISRFVKKIQKNRTYR